MKLNKKVRKTERKHVLDKESDQENDQEKELICWEHTQEGTWTMINLLNTPTFLGEKDSAKGISDQ